MLCRQHTFFIMSNQLVQVGQDSGKPGTAPNVMLFFFVQLLFLPSEICNVGDSYFGQFPVSATPASSSMKSFVIVFKADDTSQLRRAESAESTAQPEVDSPYVFLRLLVTHAGISSAPEGICSGPAITSASGQDSGRSGTVPNVMLFFVQVRRYDHNYCSLSDNRLFAAGVLSADSVLHCYCIEPRECITILSPSVWRR